MYTKHFSVWPGEKKFSDWDLECHVIYPDVTMDILADMHTYTHEFSEFLNTGDFIGNDWFQVMAFMPGSDFAPFVDIHVTGITNPLQE